MDEEEFHDTVEGPVISVNGNGEVKEDSSVEHVFTKLNDVRLSEEEQDNLPASDDKQTPKTAVTEEWGDEPLPEVEKDITKALESKEEGNKYFREKDYDLSIQHYSYAIAYCPETPEYAEQLATFYGNRSAAYYAEEEFDLVVEDCTEALKLKPDYVKVVARRMQCYDKQQKWEEALEGMFTCISFCLCFMIFLVLLDAKKLKELDPSFPKIVSTM
jgi:tetratricopeptide (TPR) repeat protein